MGRSGDWTQGLFIALIFMRYLPAEFRKLPLPHIQLEQHHVDIDLERNREPTFKFAHLATKVEMEWDRFPEIPEFPRKNDCKVNLKVNLSLFDFSEVQLCLFRDDVDKILFTPEAKINIFGDTYEPAELLNEVQPVTGFVRNNPQSRVTGYMIQRNFYGSVRFFDPFRLHHVVFYIEPDENLKKYDENAILPPRKRNALTNAILFEYVPHLNEDDPPVAEEYDDSMAPPPPERKKREITDSTGATKVTQVPNDLLKSVLSSYDDLSDSFNNGNASTPTRPVKISPRRKSKRQTKDQAQYSHENLQHADNDIVHSFQFQPGITKHNMFDVRRRDTYICELCVWLQPHFAQRFALSGSVQHGAAEMIDLIEFLNGVFRTLDFNQDGLPENIGFVIKHLYINDLVRVTKTGQRVPHRGRLRSNDDAERISPPYSFSENINTITTKSALALAQKHFKSIFQSCCISIGFIYHNMAPAISATNLRGLCTSKNVALVSGILHSTKIAKYDVFRALFHAIGHLFGGHHDDVTNLRCHETALYRFLNPFVLHPVQQLNVGMRLNSFRLSRCSKDHITQFLSSNGIHCLVRVNQTFCGNGIEEDGEECDCGALWQCHLQEECCGEGDTIFGCQVTAPYRSGCLRPRVWRK